MTQTILLVDDEDSVRGVAQRALERQGYTVLMARHAKEALEICAQHADPVHLLITDVVMPVMSGIDLAEQVTASYPETSVLYISGHVEEAAIQHVLQGQDAAFLQKPFTPTILRQRVRELLEQPSSHTPLGEL